jgi:hypothetical protein
MLWISIGFGVCFVALFRVLNFIAARQMEQDIALILAESPAMEQSPAPSMSQLSIPLIEESISVQPRLAQSLSHTI